MKNGKMKAVKLLFTLAAVICCLIGIAVDAQAATITDSGICGDEVDWTLDSNGVLTISGTGDMWDYYVSGAPWWNDDIEKIIIEDGVTHIGMYAFQDCEDATAVTIGSDVKTIGDYAFLRCRSITSIKIPNKVSSIGKDVFSDCTKLKTVVLGQQLKTIGISAFSNCTSLTEITLPESVTDIGDRAFDTCEALDDVMLGKNLQTIGADAFRECISLTQIVIPASVTSIGNHAFTECENLSRIVFMGDAPEIAKYSWIFSNVEGRAFYPAENPTWTEEIMDSFDGTLAWLPKVNILTQPKTAYAAYGKTVKTTVEAAGNGLTYQWYVRNANSDEYVKTSGTSATYSTTMNLTRDNCRVYCVITDKYGFTAQTKTVYLRMKASIITQPTSVTVEEGEKATVSVKAGGTDLQYAWYYSDNDGDSFNEASSVTGKTYSCTMSSARNGRKVYCVVTDKYGYEAKSNTVTLKMELPLSVVKQPVNKTVKDGVTAKFVVTAEGNGIVYQWQYRTSASGSWKNASATGCKTKTLSVPATISRHGYQYRCRITDDESNRIYTNVVTLNVLGIKTQPVNKIVKTDATAKFTVQAIGKGVTYQWQYRTSSSGSWKNTSATGNKTKTLSVSATAAKHGYQYRCKITDSAGNTIYTKTVNLYVLGIKTQPVNKTVYEGATVKFAVKATGKGLAYQWQYRTSSSGNWKNASATGNKTATLSIPATLPRYGYQYRCKITDSAGNVIYTNIVTLRVK